MVSLTHATRSSVLLLIPASLCFICRSRLQRERERDISEKIALGVPNARAGGDEIQFDQRLFNQSKVCLQLSACLCSEIGYLDKKYRI